MARLSSELQERKEILYGLVIPRIFDNFYLPVSEILAVCVQVQPKAFVLNNASYSAAVLEPAFSSRYQIVPESLVRVLTQVYTAFPLGQAVASGESVRIYSCDPVSACVRVCVHTCASVCVFEGMSEVVAICTCLALSIGQLNVCSIKKCSKMFN